MIEHCFRLNIFYLSLEKLNLFCEKKFDTSGTTQDIVATYEERRGDAREQIEALDITKRYASTGEDIAPIFYCPPPFTYGSVSETTADSSYGEWRSQRWRNGIEPSDVRSEFPQSRISYVVHTTIPREHCRFCGEQIWVTRIQKGSTSTSTGFTLGCTTSTVHSGRCWLSRHTSIGSLDFRELRNWLEESAAATSASETKARPGG